MSSSEIQVRPRAPWQQVRRAAGLAVRTLTTPLLPDDFVELVAPLQSTRQLHGRVLAIADEGTRARRLTVRAGRGWAGHRAGQHVRIAFRVDGVWHWRAYSLTHDANARDRLLEVTVGAVGGLVSTYVHERLSVGDLVLLDGAGGEFGFPEPVPPHVLFITAGSGITPMIGMLRSHRHELSDVVVVHSSRDEGSLAYASQLREWEADGSIRLVLRHTATEGRLRLGELDALVPDWRTRQTWVCAPHDLVKAAEQHWAEADVTENLHTEVFRPPLPVVGEGGTVTFAETGRTVESDGSTTLLDAGEEAGVLMPSGCRMGICFSCLTPLTSGSVRDLRNGELTSVTDEPLDIQTCISAAAGPCTLSR